MLFHVSYIFYQFSDFLRLFLSLLVLFPFSSALPPPSGPILFFLFVLSLSTVFSVFPFFPLLPFFPLILPNAFSVRSVLFAPIIVSFPYFTLTP